MARNVPNNVPKHPSVEVAPELEDFRNFLFLVWDHLKLPSPTPLQYEAADWLQNGPRRRMMKGYRGFGKSFATSAYVLWRLLLNPQLKILVVSASKERATAFSTFTKRLINEMPLLQHLKPDPDQGHRDSVIAFDVGPATAAHAPSVKSVGLFGAMTGSRADLIVPDDIEIPGNSDTQGKREKLRERAKEFESVLTPDGEVVILCTDQSEESVYKDLAQFYTPRCWPARYIPVEDLDKYGESLAPSLVDAVHRNPELGGQPSDPDRFDEDELQIRMSIYGRSGFALQFLLDPKIGSDLKYPLKLKDLIIYPVDQERGPEALIWSNRPDLKFNELPNVGLEGDGYYQPIETVGSYLPWSTSVMAIDPAGKGKDELAITVARQLNGYVHIALNRGFSGGYEDETLIEIAKLAAQEKVSLIRVEENFGQGMFTKLLMPHLRKYAPKVGIEEVRHSKQKELRIIDTLEPLMNQHRLVVDPRVIEADYQNTPSNVPEEQRADYRLFHQLTRITRDRGSLRVDDRLDSLQMAVGFFTEATAQSAEEEMQARKADLERKDWEDFYKGVIFGEHRSNQKPKSNADPSVLKRSKNVPGDIFSSENLQRSSNHWRGSKYRRKK